jgi:hypothetical protein
MESDKPTSRLRHDTWASNTKSEQTTLGYEERFSITKPVDEESNPFEKKEKFTVVGMQSV